MPEIGLAARAATPADADALYTVYAATREEEMAAWGWSAAQADGFLRMQFEARARSYAAAYPGAEVMLLQDGAETAGSMIVAAGSRELRLVDLALLPAYRNRGFGTALLQELRARAVAAGVPLRLSVRRENPAARLYARAGFVVTSADDVYLEMEYDARGNE